MFNKILSFFKKSQQDDAVKSVPKNNQEQNEKKEVKKPEATKQSSTNQVPSKNSKKASKPAAKKVQPKPEPKLEAWGMTLDVLGRGETTTVVVVGRDGDDYLTEVKTTCQEVRVPVKEVERTINVGDDIDVIIYRADDYHFYGSERRLKNKLASKNKKPAAKKATFKKQEERKPVDKKPLRKFSKGEIFEAKVVSFNDPLFAIELDGLKYNVHKHQIDCAPFAPFDSYVGKVLEFEVNDIIDNKEGKAPFIQLTRRNIVLKERIAKANEYKVGDELVIGDFELNKGGIVAQQDVRIFVPFAELAHNVNVNESNVNQYINKDTKVKVIGIKDDSLVCSVRACSEDPFIGFAQDFQNNKCPKQFDGIIRNIVDFGVFVDLQGAYDITGLLPFRKSEEDIKANLVKKQPGDKLAVSVADVDSESKRVTLAVI